MTNIVIERIRAQTKAFEEQRATLVKELEGNFHGMFKEVFENFPEIDHFAWTQYTPYFNDGDPCEFSRHEINAFRVMDDPDYEEESYWEDDQALIEDGDKLQAWKHYLETGKLPDTYWSHLTDAKAQQYGKANREEYILDSSYPFNNAIKSLKLEDVGREAEVAIAASEMINALESIPEDIFETMFGNHVKVTVTREGVEIEDYNHD